MAVTDCQLDQVARHLTPLVMRARRSRLEPFRKLADSLIEHSDGIVAFLETRVTNGVIEAINGLLQLAKRLARGFPLPPQLPSHGAP